MIRKTLITMGVLIGGCSTAIAQEPIVQDHTKTIIKRVPFNYEVCSEVDVPADKTKDTILGAIIGGDYWSEHHKGFTRRCNCWCNYRWYSWKSKF